MAQELRFAQTLEALMAERFRRNRAELAERALISPSALSQYVRGKATPSLDVLARLAEALDVSLHYLVFGNEHASSSSEASHFVSHLDEGLRQAKRDSAALYDLAARIGARLGDRVLDVATELLPDMEQAAGTLTADEIALIERCSVRTVIVTSSLVTEVIVPAGEAADGVSAPGLFGQTVVENIRDRHRYEYFLPATGDLRQAAELLRTQILELSRLDSDVVDSHLELNFVDRSCIPGFVMHTVSLALLREQAETVLDRIDPFLNDESVAAGYADLATVEPASRSYRHFAMLDAYVIPQVRHELDNLRATAITGPGA